MLNKNDLPACLLSFLFQDSYTSRGLKAGEWEGEEAEVHEQIGTSSPIGLCTLENVCVDGWMDIARLTAGQIAVQILSSF